MFMERDSSICYKYLYAWDFLYEPGRWKERLIGKVENQVPDVIEDLSKILKKSDKKLIHEINHNLFLTS